MKPCPLSGWNHNGSSEEGHEANTWSQEGTATGLAANTGQADAWSRHWVLLASPGQVGGISQDFQC